MSDTTTDSTNMLSLSALTVANASAALEQGVAAIRAGQTVFDLANVENVDSAAVSVMLAWQRAAHEADIKLQVVNLPASLRSLTKLYGVCTLVSPSQEDGDCICAEPVLPQHHHH